MHLMETNISIINYTVTDTRYESGDGTKENPYIIATPK